MALPQLELTPTVDQVLPTLLPLVEPGGTLTGMNDQLFLRASARNREEIRRVLATIDSFASGGLDPAYMGLGPVPAVNRALHQAGMSIDDIELIEWRRIYDNQQ